MASAAAREVHAESVHKLRRNVRTRLGDQAQVRRVRAAVGIPRSLLICIRPAVFHKSASKPLSTFGRRFQRPRLCVSLLGIVGILHYPPLHDGHTHSNRCCLTYSLYAFTALCLTVRIVLQGLITFRTPSIIYVVLLHGYSGWRLHAPRQRVGEAPRALIHLALVVGAVRDLNLQRHRLHLVLRVRDTHQVAEVQLVHAVARRAHLAGYSARQHELCMPETYAGGRPSPTRYLGQGLEDNHT